MLIKICWDEDPERRPDFKKIESSLGKIFRYQLPTCISLLLDRAKHFIRKVKNTFTKMVKCLCNMTINRDISKTNMVMVCSASK